MIDFDTASDVSGTKFYYLKNEAVFLELALVRFAMDAITGFSYFPLQLATYLGFFIAFISVFAILLVILLRLFGPANPLVGQATTLVTVLFLGSIQLICLGIIGEYLARMHFRLMEKPTYVVRDSTEALPEAVEALKPHMAEAE